MSIVQRARRVRSARVAITIMAFSIAGVLLIRHHRPPPPTWLFVSSPNYDDRPRRVRVNCVVLHATTIPSVEATVAHFRRPWTKVSAHFVVGKDGTIVQMVQTDKRAWHAGVSALGGVRFVNDFSIGIEMVNMSDGRDPYPEAQVQAVARIVRWLRTRYTIPDRRIVTHGDVALPKGRKDDPVGFDMVEFRRLCRRQTVTPRPSQ